MTTIAWDGKHLAADRRMGGWMTTGKVFPLKSGGMMSGAGYYDHLVEVAAWLDAGGERPKLSEDDPSDIFVVEDGKAYFLTWPYLRKVEIQEGYYAVGSGSHFALGALAMGADARKAIEIASRFDPDTGHGIDVYPCAKPARAKARKRA